MSLIEAKMINKYFGSKDSKVHVLKDISLKISHGEFIALMGPSGSGKSSLLFSISGMDDIDSGKLTFKGENLTSLDDKKLSDIRRRQMGFVFQNPTFLSELSIIDNIMLPHYDDYMGAKDKLLSECQELMNKLGIGDLSQRKITEVSGGQLQRAGICGAILHNPDIVFADEPTGALNSHSSKKVLDLLEIFNESGLTILLVTHDAKVAARAKRVIFMKDGKIHMDKEISDLNFNEKLDFILKVNKKLSI